jgi:hypothetical protein
MTRREIVTFIGGAAAAWPLAWRAQPTRPIVGVISPASAATSQVPEPFLRSMKELGWEEVEEQREDGFDGADRDRVRGVKRTSGAPRLVPRCSNCRNCRNWQRQSDPSISAIPALGCRRERPARWDCPLR